MPGGSNPQHIQCKNEAREGVNDDKVYQQTLSKDQMTKMACRNTGGCREGRVIQKHSIILEFLDS